jgi:hypothetical protein
LKHWATTCLPVVLCGVGSLFSSSTIGGEGGRRIVTAVYLVFGRFAVPRLESAKSRLVEPEIAGVQRAAFPEALPGGALSSSPRVA